MLYQHTLPYSSPNASWLADHIKQKKELCSPFSRQLVIQTSQAFYKQCWLIFATADVYIMCLASSPHGLNSCLVFLYCSSLYGTRSRQRSSFVMFYTFRGPGGLHSLCCNNVLHRLVLKTAKWYVKQDSFQSVDGATKRQRLSYLPSTTWGAETEPGFASWCPDSRAGTLTSLTWKRELDLHIE